MAKPLGRPVVPEVKQITAAVRSSNTGHTISPSASRISVSIEITPGRVVSGTPSLMNTKAMPGGSNGATCSASASVPASQNSQLSPLRR